MEKEKSNLVIRYRTYVENMKKKSKIYPLLSRLSLLETDHTCNDDIHNARLTDRWVHVDVGSSTPTLYHAIWKIY